jgi:predicted acetyltransferase
LFGFFTAHQMNIAGGSIGYGLEKGAVQEGFGGSIFLSAIEEARAVGKQVVRLGNQLS